MKKNTRKIYVALAFLSMAFIGPEGKCASDTQKACELLCEQNECNLRYACMGACKVSTDTLEKDKRPQGYKDCIELCPKPDRCLQCKALCSLV